jgi:hypothetical protein
MPAGNMDTMFGKLAAHTINAQNISCEMPDCQPCLWALTSKTKNQRQMIAIQMPLHPAMFGKKSIAAMFALAHHRANPLANHLAKGPDMHLAKGLARGLSNQLSI